jgi:hypothetical protein
MAIVSQYAALPSTTGNNTHQSVGLTQDAISACVDFRCTAIGATPTVTFVVQGSFDDPSVADASSTFVTAFVYPVGSDTGTAAPAAVTTVSSNPVFLAGPSGRFYKKVRVVTSANTNVTYEAKVHELATT